MLGNQQDTINPQPKTQSGQCRFCFAEDILDNLIQPCNCSGSLAFIHQSCLELWINADGSSIFCSICLQPFRGLLTQQELPSYWRTIVHFLVEYILATENVYETLTAILGVIYVIILPFLYAELISIKSIIHEEVLKTAGVHWLLLMMLNVMYLITPILYLILVVVMVIWCYVYEVGYPWRWFAWYRQSKMRIKLIVRHSEINYESI